MASILPLMATLILIFFSISLLIARRFRLRLAILWLWEVLGGTLAWLIILFSRTTIPTYITLVNWRLGIFSVASPLMLFDPISWSFALALATLGLAVVLTDVVRAEGLDPVFWAGNLALIAFGLMATFAGNPLTLALTWAVIDGLEIFLLLSRWQYSINRGQVIAIFSARLLGIFFLLVAEIMAQVRERQLVFDQIPEFVSIFLFLSSGLRLGLMPLHTLSWKDASVGRGFGLITRMVPVASSAILIVRTAMVGVPAAQAPYLLFFITLAALCGSFSWSNAKDELEGRPYWFLGVASLSLAAAVGGDWRGSLNWSMILILLGAVLFLYSSASPYLRILPILSVLLNSVVPFVYSDPNKPIYGWTLNYWTIFLLASHALLLAGYFCHIFRPRTIIGGIEGWVWVFYGFGLMFLVFSYGIFLWWWGETVYPIRAKIGVAQVISWICLIGLTAFILVWQIRGSKLFENVGMSLQPVFSFSRIYRFFWIVYRGLERIAWIISLILEGEGGVLWAFLLLALLLALVTRSGPQ